MTTMEKVSSSLSPENYHYDYSYVKEEPNASTNDARIDEATVAAPADSSVSDIYNYQPLENNNGAQWSPEQFTQLQQHFYNTSYHQNPHTYEEYNGYQISHPGLQPFPRFQEGDSVQFPHKPVDKTTRFHPYSIPHHKSKSLQTSDQNKHFMTDLEQQNMTIDQRTLEPRSSGDQCDSSNSNYNVPAATSPTLPKQFLPNDEVSQDIYNLDSKATNCANEPNSNNDNLHEGQTVMSNIKDMFSWNTLETSNYSKLNSETYYTNSRQKDFKTEEEMAYILVNSILEQQAQKMCAPETNNNDTNTSSSHIPTLSQDLQNSINQQNSSIESNNNVNDYIAVTPTCANSDEVSSKKGKREKAFKCTICNKCYVTNGHLNRHYNTALHKSRLEKLSGEPDSSSLTNNQSSPTTSKEKSIVVPPSPSLPCTSTSDSVHDIKQEPSQTKRAWMENYEKHHQPRQPQQENINNQYRTNTLIHRNHFLSPFGSTNFASGYNEPFAPLPYLPHAGDSPVTKKRKGHERNNNISMLTSSQSSHQLPPHVFQQYDPYGPGRPLNFATPMYVPYYLPQQLPQIRVPDHQNRFPPMNINNFYTGRSIYSDGESEARTFMNAGNDYFSYVRPPYQPYGNFSQFANVSTNSFYMNRPNYDENISKSTKSRLQVAANHATEVSVTNTASNRHYMNIPSNQIGEETSSIKDRNVHQNRTPSQAVPSPHTINTMFHNFHSNTPITFEQNDDAVAIRSHEHDKETDETKSFIKGEKRTNKKKLIVPDFETQGYNLTNLDDQKVSKLTSTTEILSSPDSCKLYIDDCNNDSILIESDCGSLSSKSSLLEKINNHDDKENVNNTVSPTKSEESANVEFYSTESTMSASSPTGTPLTEREYKNNTEPYSCLECNKSFSRSCYLTQHRNIYHRGYKPFKCPKCGKKYESISYYEAHLSKHEGIKPHKCHKCVKTFHYKSDLRRHILHHSGVKPFECAYCGKGFVRRDHWINHTKGHAKKLRKMEEKKS